MAVQDFTAVKINGLAGRSTVVKWAAVLTGNTGAPFENPAFSDRSVQVTGTFGGATVTIEGSNDGITWFVLTDTSAASLSFAVAGLKQILQVARYMRPVVTGGAGSLDINLLIVGK